MLTNIKGDKMTGAYLRVKRNGKYKNVEIEYLTEDELKELFLDRDKEELVKWISFLVNTIHPIAEFLKKDNDAFNN